MDKNYVLILAVVVATAIVIIAVLIHHLKRNCNPIVQLSCPNIPSSKYTDTPSGVCLLGCDQYSDVCYQNCDPRDESCIRRCYQIKAQCYMDCLGPQQENFTGNDNCGCAI